MPHSQGGDPPGIVKVPSETKGGGFEPSSFGEPMTGPPPGMAGGASMSNKGDPPGIVTVPAGTRGSHPANHPGKPMMTKQGHTRR